MHIAKTCVFHVAFLYSLGHCLMESRLAAVLKPLCLGAYHCVLGIVILMIGVRNLRDRVWRRLEDGDRKMEDLMESKKSL